MPLFQLQPHLIQFRWIKVENDSHQFVTIYSKQCQSFCSAVYHTHRRWRCQIAMQLCILRWDYLSFNNNNSAAEKCVINDWRRLFFSKIEPSHSLNVCNEIFSLLMLNWTHIVLFLAGKRPEYSHRENQNKKKKTLNLLKCVIHINLPQCTYLLEIRQILNNTLYKIAHYGIYFRHQWPIDKLLN